MIDFSLSRFQTEKYLIYTDFSEKIFDWLFEGDASEDSQYEVYRAMRAATKDWKDFNEINNVIWVRHLFEKVKSKVYEFANDKTNEFFVKLFEFMNKTKVTEEILIFIQNYGRMQ